MAKRRAGKQGDKMQPVPNLEARDIPQVYYVVDEIEFDPQHGSTVEQLQMALSRRSDEGWELVSVLPREMKTLSIGYSPIARLAAVTLIFKQLRQA
jgi:hypothetical protein